MKNLIRCGLLLSAALVVSSAMAEGGGQPLLSQGANEVWDVIAGETRLVDIPLDVTGIPSFGGFGDAGNTVMDIDVAALAGAPSGTDMVMEGVGWDVVLSAFSPSWISEISVQFNNATADSPEAINLAPGAGNNAPALGVPFASGGVLDFVDAGLAYIPLPGGILHMEFFEGFDDSTVAPDGNWDQGTLTLRVVPEPASLLLIALGALALRRR